ncbi:Uma2 family endonuclease [Bacillus canaveralius]|uniref:Uma2 family endonuclease n=1 Tax=Bacillus canaveralius TaxID=1403243 RepID=UPI000F78DCD2|nr:Uma2 family endonuclease [Bacillus canaveralius]RSK55149.1 Uma2 family endonuclease [Bacillus canaveralius]
MSPSREQGNLTYADYLALDDDVRYEVIDGRVYNMSPAPTTKHQAVQRELLTEFNIYLRGKQCSVFGSPIDVCFADEDNDIKKIKEWVEPDLVVVCDKNKIQEKRIVGVPDLIIEILSNSTAKKDKIIKFNRYQRAGVKEYWIVDPSNENIDVYLLENGTFKHSGIYFRDDRIPVYLFEEFSIDLTNIFREEE